MSQPIRAGRKFLAWPQLCVSLNLRALYVMRRSFRWFHSLKVLYAFQKQGLEGWRGIGHELQEVDFSSPLHCLLSLYSGLPGAEVRRRSFPLGHELLGQVFSRGAHQKVQPAAAGSCLHVSCIQIKRNSSINRREALHLHG